MSFLPPLVGAPSRKIVEVYLDLGAAVEEKEVMGRVVNNLKLLMHNGSQLVVHLGCSNQLVHFTSALQGIV